MTVSHSTCTHALAELESTLEADSDDLNFELRFSGLNYLINKFRELEMAYQPGCIIVIRGADYKRRVDSAKHRDGLDKLGVCRIPIT